MDEKQSNPVGAIAMKRRIQEQIYEDTKEMTPEEFITYMHRQIANSQFAGFLERIDQSKPQFDISARNPS